ncbi:MAG: hypothetical protein EOM06_09620 [Sphingobacteriia bacterium]|nr:hypothetical protein [Sphingobacteriia bacterium]
MNVSKLLIFILSLIQVTFQQGFCQETITVRASGRYFSSELTPNQTRDRAIEEAKREALNKAGVAESISFTDFSYQFEDNERFKEIFQSVSSIETGGEIIVDRVISENRSFNEFGNMVVEVEIEATIYRHKSEPDPSFRFSVDAVDQVYQNGDLLKFSFTPYQSGFLKIFNITDTDAETYLLFPYTDPSNPALNDDPDRLFVKGEKVSLPDNPAFDHGYTLELDNPDRTQEFNILMFVFTRQNIPFTEPVNFTSMMRWIYSIPPDQRATEQIGFVIKKSRN